MRKAALFYNPLSGNRRERRLADIDSALRVLTNHGVEASVAATIGPAEAAGQVRQAIAEGCDTIFACGGDGTIHDVLQGMVGTPAALAVIPLGTANALAHDLRIPLSPARAAQAALSAVPRRIAVGKVTYQSFGGGAGECYFIIAAGVGLDAHLFYKLNTLHKQRYGMGAYYLKAWHLWATHKLRFFSVRYKDAVTGEGQHTNVTQLLSVRITNFGGLLRQLAPGASLLRNDLRLLLCKTDRRSSYLFYVLRGLIGERRPLRGIELAHSERVVCELISESSGTAIDSDPAFAESSGKIYVEADGELLGNIPAEISIVPNAVTLLFPKNGPRNTNLKETRES